jgi:hypothetical protein
MMRSRWDPRRGAPGRYGMPKAGPSGTRACGPPGGAERAGNAATRRQLVMGAVLSARAYSLGRAGPQACMWVAGMWPHRGVPAALPGCPTEGTPSALPASARPPTTWKLRHRRDASHPPPAQQSIRQPLDAAPKLPKHMQRFVGGRPVLPVLAGASLPVQAVAATQRTPVPSCSHSMQARH